MLNIISMFSCLCGQTLVCSAFKIIHQSLLMQPWISQSIPLSDDTRDFFLPFSVLRGYIHYLHPVLEGILGGTQYSHLNSLIPFAPPDCMLFIPPPSCGVLTVSTLYYCDQNTSQKWPKGGKIDFFYAFKNSIMSRKVSQISWQYCRVHDSVWYVVDTSVDGDAACSFLATQTWNNYTKVY